MALEMMTWLIAIPLLGLVTGMRTMTAMMVLCWFAYGGYLPVDGTWASWSGKLVTAIAFTVLAIGEYVVTRPINRSPRLRRPGWRDRGRRSKRIWDRGRHLMCWRRFSRSLCRVPDSARTRPPSEVKGLARGYCRGCKRRSRCSSGHGNRDRLTRVDPRHL
jgi:hypothetical protein